MIALHMGGIPETAMVLGPILLIIAFIRIARRNEASLPDDDERDDEHGDEHDDWDADLGDLPTRNATTPPATTPPATADKN
ncbi:hypothetical protein AB0L70_26750 [Kribbella sp. NPDC051952]|uniref:hypothetical protein n=1 Tax=Kribbella sp. NPDC051952 TaxID=3154851 RepID=UPI00343FC438